MAFTSSDGKQFTNRPPMMAHNRSVGRMQGKSEAGGAGTKVDPLAQPAGMEQGGEQDGHAIAAEHGPAVEVHIQHDHEAGHHSVHSKHPDGHEHQSDHASAEDAHEHAGKLAGAGAREEQGEPDGDEAPQYE